MNLVFHKANTLLVTGLIFFNLIVLSSCKEKKGTETDPCGIICQNGGYCTGGSCFCTRGFEGNNCEKRWLSRYLGKWDVTEMISGSSDTSKRGQSKSYTWQIKEEEGNAVRLFIDDFSGNDSYDGISCEIGLNYMGGQELPTTYIFSQKQAVSNSYITIDKGSGSVNETGTVMSGVYYTTYLSNAVVYSDTVNFKAQFKL
jgi:hypothetical protein